MISKYYTFSKSVAKPKKYILCLFHFVSGVTFFYGRFEFLGKFIGGYFF